MFSENVPFYGYLMINGDDKNIKKISKRIYRTKITFGESKAAIIKLTILCLMLENKALKYMIKK